MAGRRRSTRGGGVEGGIVGDGDGGPGDQACSLVGIDPFGVDIGISDSSQPDDLWRNRCTRILELLPYLANPDGHTTGIEGETLDRQIDDRMIGSELIVSTSITRAVRISPCGMTTG